MTHNDKVGVILGFVVVGYVAAFCVFMWFLQNPG